MIRYVIINKYSSSSDTFFDSSSNNFVGENKYSSSGSCLVYLIYLISGDISIVSFIIIANFITPHNTDHRVRTYRIHPS